jgi:hypothetical protein
MLWQQPCNGNAAQNWEFIPQSNSYFVIKNQAATADDGFRGTPMVIDDYYGEATQGLQMWLAGYWKWLGSAELARRQYFRRPLRNDH